MSDLYREPIEILRNDEFNHGRDALMTEFDLSFLCGMIKKYRPKKILELGVAAGGTTAVIMNCCKMLGLNVEHYSVDLLNHCCIHPD